MCNSYCLYFQFVEENNRKILRDTEEIRKICELCIVKYDRVARKAKRGKESEYEKLLQLVLKESENRADLNITRPILDDVLKSS